MFRVKDSDIQDRLSPLTMIVLSLQVIALLAALAALTWASFRVSRTATLGSAAPGLSGVTLRSFWELVFPRLVMPAIVVLAQVAGLVSFLRLQSRHKASQRSIQQVKLLAHNILASMDHGVVTTDPQGSITSINSAAIRLLRADPECVGRPISSISSEEAPLADLHHRVVSKRAPAKDVELRVARDGSTRWLLANAFDLRDTHGEALGSVIHILDVTERLLMKEQVWRMEQFDRLSTLAAGLHHEIKNPLTALSIHVQLLEEHLLATNPSEKTREFLGVLKAEVRRLSGVLESFRNFASLERLSVRPTDVGAMLESVRRLMDPQAALQQVRLAVSIPGRQLPTVLLDSEKIEQAVLNLVVNALEAMPGGGSLTLSAAVTDGRLQIEVEDTGQGIPPEIQSHIFGPYFTTKTRGSGMGLALVEKLVRQHGGRVDFGTGPEGTSFRITLPREDSVEVNGRP
jgi:PAS domain S-box-containing protein